MGGRLRVRIHYARVSHLTTLLALTLSVAVFLGYLAWGRGAASAAAGESAQSAAPMAMTQSWYAPAPRSYYLSRTDHTGAQTHAACAAGYHMAALWEIADPSNLRYDTALGESRSDSGAGPPSFVLGWARTGYDSDASSTPGQANCNAWTSSSSSDNGSVINLPADWTDASSLDMGVWDVGYAGCDGASPVWCVADAPGMGVCEEPLHISCGDEIDGDTTNYTESYPAYSCSEWNESGPETIYAFTLAEGGFYTVTATLSNLSVDLDVFLLSSSGCAAAQCYSATSFGNFVATGGPLAPGTYYIAVDGYYGALGSYTLALTCESGPGRRVYLPLVLRNAGA